MTAGMENVPAEDSSYRAIFEASSDGLVINDADTGVVLAANPAFCQMHGHASMAGLDPRTFIHPSSHHLFQEYVRTVRSGREFRARAQDVRRDGTVFEVEVLGRAFEYQGRPALLGVVRDVTEHVRAFQKLEQLVGARTREIELRRQELEALYHADERLYQSLRLDDVLQALVDEAARLLHADKTSVLVWQDERRQRLAVRASHGFAPEQLTSMSFGPGEGISGQVAALGEPIVVQDVRNDPRVPARVNQVINTDDTIRSLVSVPIKLENEVFGVFNVNSRRYRGFGDDEQRLLLALAQRAAIAIQNARLHEESEERRQDLEVLYHADQALHRSLRLEEVLDALIELPVAIGQAEMVSLLLWDEEQGRFVVGGVRGLSQEILQESFTLAEARIARHRSSEIVEVEDVATDSRISDRLRATVTREGVRAWISSPLRIAGHLFGSFSFGYGHVHHFTQREKRLLVALSQRAALAIENARLHEQSESQRHELAALYEADETMHRSLRLHDVIDALLDAAMGLLQADGAGVWGVDSASGTARPLAARGISSEYLAQTLSLNDDPDVLAFWWSSGRFAVDDLSTDPRVPPSQRELLEREGFRSLLTTQIHVGQEAFGSFTVAHRTPHTFTEQEQRLLNALAQRAGLAIQNARLYEQAQQAATLDERQRLARELHDAVTQTLFSAALIAEVLPELWDLDAEEGRQRLTELRRLTRGALAEMRTLLLELRPGALAELALGDLLRQLADAIAGRARLEVRASVHGQPRRVPSEVHIALYRLAQEALNNSVKHAQAHNVDLELSYLEDGVGLRVSDDGCGFSYDPALGAAGHFGLRIMRERAESINATFHLETRPGAGTIVEVTWRRTEDTAA